MGPRGPGMTALAERPVSLNRKEIQRVQRVQRSRHKPHTPPARPVHVRRTPPNRIGVVLLIAAAGLGTVVLGDWLGYRGRDAAAITCLWTGITATFVVCSWRLIGASASRRERLQVTAVLATVLLLAFHFSESLMLGSPDELMHMTSLWQLATQGRFFGPNSLLVVSPLYPGLELFTLGIHWGTGIPLVISQFVALELARLWLFVGIFLVVERATRSQRAGGIAVVAYAACDQTFAFNSQYAYQTLAIALAVAAVYLLMTEVDRGSPRLGPRFFAAIACLAGLTITHHLTSWITVGFLLVAALTLGLAHRRAAARTVGLVAAWGLIFVGLWTVLVGSHQLYDYLGSSLSQSYHQIVDIFSGRQTHRAPFTQSGIAGSSVWEEGVTVASVLGWCGVSAVLVWHLVQRRRVVRGGPWANVLVIGLAASYPVTLIPRLAFGSGSQISDRVQTFIFFSLALAVAGWLVGFGRKGVSRRPPPRSRVRGIAIALAAPILFVGGLVLGAGPNWNLVPGPHLVAAGQRSIDTTTVAAARWAAANLPQGSRIISDFSNDLALGAIGHLTPVVGDAANVDEAPLFYSNSFTAYDRHLIDDAHARFLLVDARLATGTPLVDNQYFAYETSQRIQRLTPEELDKFNSVPGMVRIYDDGTIRIYDLSALIGKPLWHPTPPASLRTIDMSWTPGLVLLAAVVLAVWVRRLRRSTMTADRILVTLAIGSVVLMGLAAVAVVAPVPTPLLGGAALAAVLLWVTRPRSRRTATPERQPGSPAPRLLLGSGVALLAVVVGCGVAVGLHDWGPGPTELSLVTRPGGGHVVDIEPHSPLPGRATLTVVAERPGDPQPLLRWGRALTVAGPQAVRLPPLPEATRDLVVTLRVAGAPPEVVGGPIS